MYTEKVKFKFNRSVSHSERLGYMSELFEALEKEEIDSKKMESGGIYSYQIKHNGAVSLSSFYPGSTSIIRDFIKMKEKENVLK